MQKKNEGMCMLEKSLLQQLDEYIDYQLKYIDYLLEAKYEKECLD